MKLRDVATITQGNTPSRNHPEYWNGTIPWVPTALIQNQLITDELIEERITKTGLQKTSMKIFPKGTILMAMIGQGKTRGQIAMLDLPAAINQNAAAIILNDSVYAKYIYHQLHSKYDEIRAMSNGAGQQNLNTELIGSIDIFLPHISEQKNTAILLDYWDSAIEKTERLIELKKQAYLSFSSRLYTPPRENRLVRLGELCHEISDRNGRRFGRVLSVTNHSGFVLPEEQFSKRVASEDLSNYKVVRKGQYAYNPSRINVGSIARLEDWDEGVLSPMYTVFELKTGKVDSDYFLHWLSSPPAKKSIAQCAQGSVRETVAFSDFSAIDFPLAEPYRQREISQLLNSARHEISLLQRELALLNQQKSFLMSKLLTGEWEAPDMGAEDSK